MSKGKRVNIYLPELLWERLILYIQNKHGTSQAFSLVVSQAIKEFLDREGQNSMEQAIRSTLAAEYIGQLREEKEEGNNDVGNND